MERRLMTMQKAKLKMLDANTTGSQNTRDDTLKSPDFLNKYGDTVALEWIRDNKELMPVLGYPNHSRIRDEFGYATYILNNEKTGAIRQLTGRAGLLFVKDQERLFKELLAAYTQQIALEKQQGTYDLEIEFLQLDADIQKRYLYLKGIGGKSAFGNDTVREQTLVNNLNRPFTAQQVERRIAKALNGYTPEYVQQQLIQDINDAHPKLLAQQEDRKQKKIEKLQAKLTKLQAQSSSSDTAQKELEILPKLIQQEQASLKQEVARINKVINNIKKHINIWKVGDAIRIVSRQFDIARESPETSWGVFLGVTIGKGNKNPYTLYNVRFNFAIADSQKALSLTLGHHEELLNSIFKESTATKITAQEQQDLLKLWNDRIKHASSKREIRHILTGNILASATSINRTNRLIKYNTQAGTIQSGILIGRDSDLIDFMGSIYPISEAVPHILKLKIGNYFTADNDSATFKKLSSNTIQVLLNKRELYKAIINPELQQLLIKSAGTAPHELPDFVQNANEMTGVIPIKNLAAFLKILNTYGVFFLDTAKELDELKDGNEADWQKRTARSTARFIYELGKAYGKTSHPTSGFENYFEGDPQYPYGRVVYNRQLTDKERYNYTLIPVYKDADAVYNLWKTAQKQTAVWGDFTTLLDQIKNEPIYTAIERIGFFIFNHAHEKGNPEFVFGRYNTNALGKAAYIDQIKPISPMMELVGKLQLQQHFLKTA